MGGKTNIYISTFAIAPSLSQRIYKQVHKVKWNEKVEQDEGKQTYFYDSYPRTRTYVHVLSVCPSLFLLITLECFD